MIFRTLLQKAKALFNEISIEIDVQGSSPYSVQAELEVETAAAIYSYRYERWFSAYEVTPLETTWGDGEAALTNDGFVLLATECVWNDGYSVSNVEVPSSEVMTFPGFRAFEGGNKYASCVEW